MLDHCSMLFSGCNSKVKTPQKTFRFLNYPCEVDTLKRSNLFIHLVRPDLPGWAAHCLLAALLLRAIAFSACPGSGCPGRASVSVCVSSFQVVRSRLEGGPSEGGMSGFWIYWLGYSFCLLKLCLSFEKVGAT